MRLLWRKKLENNKGGQKLDDAKQNPDQATLEQITKNRQELLDLLKVLKSL